MKHLLGIDIGTTSLKGCVFDETGKEIASTTKSYTLITKGNTVEFVADDYYKLFLEAYNELSSKVKIDAFSIDTQGETMIFLDKDGNALLNAIVWLDNRAEEEAKEIEAKFGLKTIYEVTGQTEVPAGYPAPKILWLKKNMPETFKKVDKIVLLEDYLIYRLTGKFACEKSLYSSTLYLDINTGEYYEEMLDFIGITKNQLPTLYESGEVVGTYNGATVSTGALDQIAGFIGSGIISEGIVSEMTGTALAVCALSKTVPPYYEGIKVPAYYIAKDKYCLLMWAPTAGMVMEWFRKNLYDNEKYSVIDSEAEKIPFASEGLIISPNMCGQVMPTSDSGVKGGVYGIELKHTKAHFARAIMESVACLLRQYLECLNLPIDKVISIGGGSKSKLWLQIKADITKKKVVTLNNKEVACLGTAIYAGLGSGIYKDINSAINGVIEFKDEVLPKVSQSDADELYNKYLSYDKMLLNRENNLK